MKQLISIVLCLFIMLSIMPYSALAATAPITVSADTFDPDTSSTHSWANGTGWVQASQANHVYNYNINPGAGFYDLSVFYSTRENNASVKVSLDGTLVGIYELAHAEGWQNGKASADLTNILITEGEHVITFAYSQHVVYTNSYFFLASFTMTPTSAPGGLSLTAELKDASGAVLEQTDLADAKTTNVTVTGLEEDAYALIAAYDNNNKMLFFDKTPISGGRAIVSHSFTLENTTTATRISVFLWKDLFNAEPLTGSFSFYKTRFSATAEELFWIDQAVGQQPDPVTGDRGIRSLPFLYSFDDTVIATYSQHTDSYEVSPVDAIKISRDGGKTWNEKYTNSDFYFTSMIKRSTGELFGINYITYYTDKYTDKMYYWTSPDDGKTWVKHEGKVNYPNGNNIKSTSSNWGGMVFHRTLMELPDKSLLATMYGQYSGDAQYRVILVRSTDNGATWNPYSEVASGAPIASNGMPATSVEGFCEPSIVECADGSWLCVMRIGNGQPLYQTRSFDKGLTWTTPEILPGISNHWNIHSVDPELCLMQDGTLALAYGRPSSKLIFSLDGCGYNWDESSIMTLWSDGGSSYEGLTEVSPGRLLVIGDRSMSHQLMDGVEYGIWGRFINVEHRKSSNPTPVSAVLSSPTTYLQKGSTTQLTLRVIDQDGRLYDLDSADVSYKDSAGVVTISDSGLVTAVSDGTAVITATVKGLQSNAVKIDIGEIVKLSSIDASFEASTIAPNATTQIIVTPKNFRDDTLNFENITLSYSSDAESVATVDDSGVVSAHAIGTANITVSAKQGDDTPISKVITLSVREGNKVITSDFENDTVGEAPASFTVNPSTDCVSVSTDVAASGTKSVHLNDKVSNAMSALRMSDAYSATSRSVEFKAYPKNLDSGLAIMFHPTDDFSPSVYAFYVLVEADGSVVYYQTAAATWHELFAAGTVKFNAWNTFKIDVDNSKKSLSVTVNGTTQTAENIAVTGGHTSTKSVGFSSASTYTANGCEVYFDDVTLYGNEISDASSVNLFTNGGFEDGTTGWTGFGASLTSETNERYCGNKAVAVKKSASYGYIGQKVSVEPGKTYSMSANVKLSTGTGKTLFLAGTYVDSTGATKYITLKQANGVQPGSWQSLSGTCTIPDGVTEITFYVQVYLDADVSLETIQEILYVDNVKLTIVQ